VVPIIVAVIVSLLAQTKEQLADYDRVVRTLRIRLELIARSRGAAGTDSTYGAFRKFTVTTDETVTTPARR